MLTDSFVFHSDWVEFLTDEQAETFAQYCVMYALTGKEPEFTEKGFELAFWKKVKTQIDYDLNQKQKAIENGKKGGRPTTTKPNENPKETPAFETEKPNENPNESGGFETKKPNVNVNANVNATATANNDEPKAAAGQNIFDKRKKEFDGAICLLFNTTQNSFTPDFTVGVLKLCEQNNVTNYSKYLKFVFDCVKKKNPANFSGLFYKMAQSADVMQEFIKEFKPITYKQCPCCNGTIKANTVLCPKCGFDLTRKDEPGYIQEWRDFMQSRGFG